MDQDICLGLIHQVGGFREARPKLIGHLAPGGLGRQCGRPKEVLELWLAETEGAKFWLSVLAALRNQGLKKVFIAYVDGSTGFPEAIRAGLLAGTGLASCAWCTTARATWRIKTADRW